MEELIIDPDPKHFLVIIINDLLKIRTLAGSMLPLGTAVLSPLYLILSSKEQILSNSA